MSMILLAGLVLVRRNKPNVREFTDHTENFQQEVTRDNWSKESSVQKLDDLTKVGYSPEVARAIIQSEKKVIDESMDNQL